MFQLDDSKSLYRKWLFHQTSIYKWLFGVPGSCVKELEVGREVATGKSDLIFYLRMIPEVQFVKHLVVHRVQGYRVTTVTTLHIWEMFG